MTAATSGSISRVEREWSEREREKECEGKEKERLCDEDDELFLFFSLSPPQRLLPTFDPPATTHTDNNKKLREEKPQGRGI